MVETGGRFYILSGSHLQSQTKLTLKMTFARDVEASVSHYQQSFSGLLSPGRSNSVEVCNSRAQTIFFFAQSADKVAHTRCDWFWSCFSLVEKLTRYFEPITKRSNRNRVVAFDSHLKTATGAEASLFKKKKKKKKKMKIPLLHLFRYCAGNRAFGV